MGGVSPPFRLVAGAPAPLQQSSVTCGAACLTVARMLVDDPFARWVRDGTGHPVLGAEGESPAERFASYERTVHRRTNGLTVGRTGIRPPWPRALGTPPWGARAELENGASTIGTRYAYQPLRHLGREARLAAYDRLVDRVHHGEPALLYVGNRTMPRHVTLVLPGDGDRVLDIYDPGSGTVRVADRDAAAHGRLGLSGWQEPWLLVQPSGHRRVRSRVAALQALHLPRLAPEPTPELQRGR